MLNRHAINQALKTLLPCVDFWHRQSSFVQQTGTSVLIPTLVFVNRAHNFTAIVTKTKDTIQIQKELCELFIDDVSHSKRITPSCGFLLPSILDG